MLSTLVDNEWHLQGVLTLIVVETVTREGKDYDGRWVGFELTLSQHCVTD